MNNFKTVPTSIFPRIQVTILNDGTGPQDVLNEGCGADFVKVGQKAAKKFEGFVDGERCASIDGDADRLVYFYTDKSDTHQAIKVLHNTF